LKLYRKLVLFTLAAAVLPLTAVGFTALRGAEKALSARISVEQMASARRAADSLGRDLDTVFDHVRQLAVSWAIDRLTDPELTGFLRLLLGLSPHVASAALTEQSGRLVVPVVHSSRTAGDLAQEEAFLRQIPAREAIAHGFPVLSPAFTVGDGQPRAALAFPVKGRGGRSWVVGVLLDLESFHERLEYVAGATGGAAVLDADGRVLLSSGVLSAPDSAADREAVVRFRAAGGRAGEYLGASGESILAAYAPVPGDAGWGLFVRLPAAQAFAEVSQLRKTALAGSLVSLGAFLLIAWLFVRGVTRGLTQIDVAARELGRGNLAMRVPVRGSDEVAHVSATLNQVGAELESARARLERWNEELRAEVEARTLEVKEAQARLLQSNKMAAIGQLGAGVAHEINNPLTGVLGYAQLLLSMKKADDPDHATLEKVEHLAKRCREITHNLLRFSQQRESPDFQEVELNEVMRDTLSMVEGQVREAGVTLELTPADPSPVVRGDPGHLTQVLLSLVTNARVACMGRQDPRITIKTGCRGEEAFLEVSDTGKGIPPEIQPRIFEPFFTTKDVWSNVGLGLSVSYRIVKEHGGDIQVESQVGEGSTFTVKLPLVAPAVVHEQHEAAS
jgi:signal transduction histidine kinase